MEFCVVVEGDPIAKGRPRAHSRGYSYTPTRTRNAEAAFREAVSEVYDGEPFTTPVGVELFFLCKTRRRVDWDNLAKLATDAMNGVVYTDDVLIEECRVRVMRGAHHPRTEVRVYPL